MEVKPFTLAQMWTDLTGRKVHVSDAADEPASSAAKVWAVYDVHPESTELLLTADRNLVASLGGALAGLPEKMVQMRLQEGVDEVLLDAMHEILNITASVVVREGRAVLRRMIVADGEGMRVAQAFRQKPHYQSRYSAMVTGYEGGQVMLTTLI